MNLEDSFEKLTICGRWDKINIEKNNETTIFFYGWFLDICFDFLGSSFSFVELGIFLVKQMAKFHY